MTQAIAKQVRRSLGECCSMYRMLKDYEKLGEATLVVKNGIQITKCPPASASGAGSYRLSAGGRENSAWTASHRQPARVPETRLAAAKLLLMFEILGGRVRETPNRGTRQKILDDAHRWFFGKSDLEFWCGVAGYEVADIRKRAALVRDYGLPASPMSRNNS